MLGHHVTQADNKSQGDAVSEQELAKPKVMGLLHSDLCSDMHPSHPIAGID